MANILIAARNIRYHQALMDTLKAAGHDVTTASDTVLALAALRVSQRRFIALLSEGIRLHEIEERDMFEILANDERGFPQLAKMEEYLRHAYILLTTLPPEELPDGLRAIRTYGGAALLDPDCSMGTLLAAIELAAERLALDELAESKHESHGLTQQSANATQAQ